MDDRFLIFRELLDFMTNRADVIDADMRNYCGDMEITGDDGEKIIKIVVSIENKEEKKDD